MLAMQEVLSNTQLIFLILCGILIATPPWEKTN
jgi:hypothetical protein